MMKLEITDYKLNCYNNFNINFLLENFLKPFIIRLLFRAFLVVGSFFLKSKSITMIFEFSNINNNLTTRTSSVTKPVLRNIEGSNQTRNSSQTFLLG